MSPGGTVERNESGETAAGGRGDRSNAPADGGDRGSSSYPNTLDFNFCRRESHIDTPVRAPPGAGEPFASAMTVPPKRSVSAK